jgi:hypothetical protein
MFRRIATVRILFDDSRVRLMSGVPATARRYANSERRNDQRGAHLCSEAMFPHDRPR